MDRVQVIEHAGKTIVQIDFSRCNAVEALVVIERASETIRSKPLGSVLTLTDVTDLTLDEQTVNAMRVYVEGNKPYVKAAAVVGASGLTRAVLGSLRVLTRRQLAGFDDLDEAKAWLVRA
jgi:hypothetical protein